GDATAGVTEFRDDHGPGDFVGSVYRAGVVTGVLLVGASAAALLADVVPRDLVRTRLPASPAADVREVSWEDVRAHTPASAERGAVESGADRRAGRRVAGV